MDLNGCSWMEVTGTPVTPWETVENDVAQRGGLENTWLVEFHSNQHINLSFLDLRK